MTFLHCRISYLVLTERARQYQKVIRTFADYVFWIIFTRTMTHSEK